MSPLLLLRRAKYAAGFRERLGNYPDFRKDHRPVIWLHCVSVGETNAARPLVDELLAKFPGCRLILSTTTRTGQELAENIFKNKADAVFYFPFDWKFSVRRALRHFHPSMVLLMETEIWPGFFREAHYSETKIAIVNGRLSEKSFLRYSYIEGFLRRVLGFVSLALMQTEKDAERLMSLGLDPNKIHVTGNLKFDLAFAETENAVTEEFRKRFCVDGERTLIVAASTHEPEEKWVLESLAGELGKNSRLLIAPRHPERFENVATLLSRSPHTFSRRSDKPSDKDRSADVILLDSIGELRAVYPLADVVFVGGSLIPHGGQSVLEPAAAGKAIVTGPYTANFDSVVKEFLACDAILQTAENRHDSQIPEHLSDAFTLLLRNKEKRAELGRNAAAMIRRSNREPTKITVEYLTPLLRDPRTTES